MVNRFFTVHITMHAVSQFCLWFGSSLVHSVADIERVLSCLFLCVAGDRKRVPLEGEAMPGDG